MLEFVQCDPNELTIHPFAPLLPDAHEQKVREYMERYGWSRPILITPHGEVIYGATVVKIAQQLHWPTVGCHVYPGDPAVVLAKA